MPPGIGDATLDIINLVKRIRFLIATTPSQLAYATVEKLTTLLSELHIPIVGILENMKRNASPSIKPRVEQHHIRLLGAIPFDPKIEEAIGNTETLLGTAFAKKLEEIVSKNPLF